MKHGPNRRQQPSQKPSESVAAQPLLDSSTPVRTPLKHKRTYRRPQPETVKQLRPRQPKQAPRRGKATGLSSLKAYRFCYFTGIQVMRMGKRYLRRLRALRDELKARRTQHANDRSHRMQRRWGRILRSFTTPFRETLLRYRTLVARFREGHNDRQPGFAVSAWFALASCKPLATLVASYLLPFVTLVVLLVSVHHYTAMTLGLSVNYEGQSLGIIQSEAVFSEAQKAIQERIITAEADSQSTITPTYSLTPAQPEDLTDAETLANRLITASGGTLEEADGFYLSDTFMGAVKDGDKLLDYLSHVLEQDETDAEDETVSFIKSMSLKEGLYPSSSVIPLHELVDKISGDEQVEKVYIIEAGDTPTGVASKNNMPYAELKALNPEIESTSFFQIGNEVLISQAESYLATKVTRTEVYEEDIAFGTDSIPDDRYPQGYTVVVSNGVAGKQTVTANVTYIDGVEESRTVLKTVVTREPVNKVVRAGTMTPQQYVSGLDQSGSGFIWPVDWGYFNGSLGSYWGHTGMDIAGNYGAPVRASKSGTVVRSAWYGPYGMHVIIDHGNGVTTLYAHMSAKYVSVGQYVVQGEMIGLVGRTGNVTGPHLHFEVRINGAYQDPINYIGTYKR